MWWVIVGIVVLLVIGASVASNEQKIAKIASMYPEKLKPLLREEFPEFSEMFTTSFCSLYWTESLAFAKQKTGQKDDVAALQKIEKIYTKPKNKEQFEDEFLEIMRKHYHPDFSRMLRESPQQRAKLDRVIELASSQALSEIM